MKTSLTKSDKSIFFEGMHDIQKTYNDLVENESFEVAETYKFKSVSEYILKNKDDILRIRDILFNDQKK